ncbi:MAG: N-formylglutamate amidohydrolase [Lachnospiraceae bacterium]|nr:N-formylglutamate amidohydrolase [Lachnospiraceae bacterium]
MKKRSPIVVNVPHSSTFIPEEERKYFVTEKLDHELLVMTDHYCDDLYDVGYEMIRFPVSRLVCDFERFRDDSLEVMSAKGMGACYTSCSDLSELRHISDRHKEGILRRYYDTYHKALELAVEERLGQFGYCIIVDGHSFPSVPLPYEYDQKRDRPDICIGSDEFHTPELITDGLCKAFEDNGYRVSVNEPFAGALVPMRYYCKDKRVMSVMIEINRRLYINGQGEITNGYERVKEAVNCVFSGCIEKMANPA